jgi:DNA-binding CsgD family transcriptional regulator
MSKDLLQKRIEDKIKEIAAIAEEIPGVIIIHELPDFIVHYMSPRGLKAIGKTLAEVEKMTSKEYHDLFFNAEDANDYVPKIAGLLDRNTDETVNYFQQVRTSKTHDWDWYLSGTRILLRNDENKPVLTITIAMHIDPKHHITSKVSRLLDENNFLRKNFERYGTLTNREKEVLKQQALGKTSSQISKTLHISSATVETHRKNIKRKLNISSSFDLSMYARAFDLI